jgi:prepilin-type N-terminal cleavage/methylation domain-containing protein
MKTKVANFKRPLRCSGFSLIETLVVIAVFALISVIVSRSVAVSIVGTRKSDSSALVRENLNLAVSAVERRLRSASKITTSCTGTPEQSIQFINEDGVESRLFCNPGTCTVGGNTYIGYVPDISAPGLEERLTNSDSVCITACEFVCSPQSAPGGLGLPPAIRISVEGRSKGTSGVEDTSVRLETGVSLRAY